MKAPDALALRLWFAQPRGATDALRKVSRAGAVQPWAAPRKTDAGNTHCACCEASMEAHTRRCGFCNEPVLDETAARREKLVLLRMGACRHGR